MYDNPLKSDGIYFAYLRKSREDRDAEKNGAEDTLARHEYIITEYCKRCDIHISRWYREVVSGETIKDRPEMVKLLHDVEAIRPDGVVCVEVERLSRGNPQDQGRVMDTFKYSGTLIVTPAKIYDLTKENDEEWMDFGLLRSRMEYRTIKRRLQNGRYTSALQGKFIGNTAPFGWRRIKLQKEKGFSLEPDPETSPGLLLAYDLIAYGTAETNFQPVGITTAGHILYDRGYHSPAGKTWNDSQLSRILKNPVNIGMVRIGHRKTQIAMEDGYPRKSRPINRDCMVVPARWKGQVDPDLFQLVCDKLERNTSTHSFQKMKAPLAGLIHCGICGRSMTRRPAGGRQPKDALICTTYRCPTVCSYYDLVEARLLESLDNFLESYRLRIDDTTGIDWTNTMKVKEARLAEINASLDRYQAQSDRIHTLFEQEIYDLDTFLTRKHKLDDEHELLQEEKTRILKDIDEIQMNIMNKDQFIPYFESILASYRDSDDPIYKNHLLKEIVSDVIYTKTEKGSRANGRIDSFTLDVYVNLKAHPS